MRRMRNVEIYYFIENIEDNEQNFQNLKLKTLNIYV